jgi:hypothetical protein
MLLRRNGDPNLIQQVARLASQSKDKSLFSLLLLLEEQTSHSPLNHEIGKQGMTDEFDQPPPLFLNPSRYVE